MAAEEPPEVQRSRVFVENGILTSWYRVLSFYSLHLPITEVFTVSKWLSLNTDYRGDVYWLVEQRVANWDNIIVNQNPTYPVTMNLRIFGSPLRAKNTVLARVGFFKLYLIDTVLSTLNLPFSFIDLFLGLR